MKRQPPDKITTRHGLLYQFGRSVVLPDADNLAVAHGYRCAEEMVRALEAQQRAANASGKPRARIPAQSPRRVTEGKEYSLLRKSFLLKRPVCEVPHCGKLSKDVHHKAGRGKNYLRVATWMAVCRAHHDKIHAEPTWAKASGFLTK